MIGLSSAGRLVIDQLTFNEFDAYAVHQSDLEVETALTEQSNPESNAAAAEIVAASTPAEEAVTVPSIVSPEEPAIPASKESLPVKESAPPPESDSESDEMPEQKTIPAAEKGLNLTELSEKRTSGAKARVDFAELTARLKSCPDTKLSFSAADKAHVELAGSVRGLKPPPPSESNVSSASVTSESVSAPGSVTEPPAASEPTPEPQPVPVAQPHAIPVAKPAVEPDHPTPPQPAPKPFIKLETRDDEANLSPFSVVVEQVYDGPLDLLLDLIRKQDIDIYDIPIAKITAQFLAYVNQLKASDVDVAGEFIYIASLLIHIKSKMLLPRSPAGPEEAAEDPRRELVERLLEHERFKNAAQMLQQKQMLEAATWTNPGFREFQDDVAAEPEIAADTVDLVRIFRDILERVRTRPVFDVDEDSVTVGQMIQFLARRLTMEDKPMALRRLLSHTRSERALIAMFLALLELVRLQAVLLRQDRAVQRDLRQEAHRLRRRNERRPGQRAQRLEVSVEWTQSHNMKENSRNLTIDRHSQLRAELKEKAKYGSSTRPTA